MWYVRTMESHSALKRKDIWTHATVWVNLEDITASEINPVTDTLYVPLTRGV